MKKTMIIFILSMACAVSVFGQVRDTLDLYSCDVILETEGFRRPPMVQSDSHRSYGWLYIYLKQYERPQKHSAGYLWVYYGDPLCSYMFPNIDYQVYFQGDNRYGGKTEKCRSDDGLYFRQDTYKQHVNYRVSVMYFFVREEDVELFDRILDNVEIIPHDRQ